MPEVVVVGAGPVGTLMAAELTRRGIEVTLLERRSASGGGSRAIGVHAPVLAALEPSGITDRLLASAVRVGRGEARGGDRVLGVVRFDRLSMRFPFVATLPQPATEAALASGAPEPLRSTTVTGIHQSGNRMRVTTTGPDGEREVTADAVVVATGAGARDLVYRRRGVPVREYADRYIMSDVALPPRDDADIAIVNLARDGVLESFPLPGGVRRFVAWDGNGEESDAATRPDRLRTALAARGEADAAASVVEATTFRVRRAVAPRLRRGRLFVIGDTAHEVSPIGGQGMNLGLLDAVGLAPLLARWLTTDDAPEVELARWEARRVRSARVAAGMAALNTSLGRPLGERADRARQIGVRAMLSSRSGMLFAHAYAMGFDRGA